MQFCNALNKNTPFSINGAKDHSSHRAAQITERAGEAIKPSSGLASPKTTKMENPQLP